MKYNFDDIDFQIELNKKRLEIERNRYNDFRNRIPILTLLYTVYVGYTIQLFKFAFLGGYFLKWYFGIPFSIFVVLFLVSLYYTIKLIIPKNIAHQDLPLFFYKDVKKMYNKQEDIQENEIKYYIRESYKYQLEESVEKTFKLCNKQSKLHYWSLVLALAALIPYMICIGVKLSKEPDDIIKIEIIEPINL